MTDLDIFRPGELIEALKALLMSGHKVSIACTGAGAGVANHIWSIPGASNVLVDFNFPYATTAFNRYVGHNWAETGYSYCSEKAAVALAQAAYFRCQRACTEAGDLGSRIVGVGMTAAASTTRELRGGTRCYAAIRTAKGIFTFSMKIPQAKLGREVDGSVCDLVTLNMLFIATGVHQVHISKSLGLESDQFNEDADGYILKPDTMPLPVITNDLKQAILITTAGDPRLAAEQDFTNTLIYPGAFNPWHWGHYTIARNAQLATGFKVLFEITARNVDKAEESADALALRAEQFAECWPVVLRRDAGLFVDKLRAYPNCAGFIVGADTAIRILDPAWYEGEAGLRAVLQEFMDAGVRFYVVNRLLKGVLTTVDDLRPPKKYGELFVPLVGRWDISSSEIRTNES